MYSNECYTPQGLVLTLMTLTLFNLIDTFQKQSTAVLEKTGGGAQKQSVVHTVNVPAAGATRHQASSWVALEGNPGDFLRSPGGEGPLPAWKRCWLECGGMGGFQERWGQASCQLDLAGTPPQKGKAAQIQLGKSLEVKKKNLFVLVN